LFLFYLLFYELIIKLVIEWYEFVSLLFLSQYSTIKRDWRMDRRELPYRDPERTGTHRHPSV